MRAQTKSIPLLELAELVNARLQGDARQEISALNGIDCAGPGEITFVRNARKTALAEASQASAFIVPPGGELAGKNCLIVEEPEVAAARIHAFLLEKPFLATGIHSTALIGEHCEIPAETSIGAYVVIGSGVRLGRGVTIGPGTVLGDGVSVGENTVLHARVTVYPRCTIGKRSIVHAGAVIGADGFGFATDCQGRHYKKPQVGTVCIEDDVEIGANTCIDRAAFGVTHIKCGAKIDNLVMIGHNVVVGEDAMVVAQAGIAGSTTLGRSAVLAAQVGVADHLQLGGGVQVAAKSGVHKNVADGEKMGGYPALPANIWMKANAIFGRLPEIMKKINKLCKDVDSLKARARSSRNKE